jgi:type I restriction enzyme S subunit
MFRERKQMTGQANVNSTKLKALPIALPELVHQERLLAHLDRLREEVGTLTRFQAQTSAELDALIPSILNRAFQGEL